MILSCIKQQRQRIQRILFCPSVCVCIMSLSSVGRRRRHTHASWSQLCVLIQHRNVKHRQVKRTQPSVGWSPSLSISLLPRYIKEKKHILYMYGMYSRNGCIAFSDEMSSFLCFVSHHRRTRIFTWLNGLCVWINSTRTPTISIFRPLWPQSN